MFYYSATPNYTVDISSVAKLKSRAAAAHTSQFDPMVDRYDKAAITLEHLAQLAAQLLARTSKEDGRYVERFRRSTNY